ncbi:MAG TPA: FAD-dependent oxidoreductase [Ilumatobacteraceae bacterium]|nr:FAD-dependent oxidoreductase [Ilumatobacteraceae bacterium]
MTSQQSGALRHVVVVGASLAGLRACESLREEGFDGTITLVGAEHEIPYDRPPLSKKVLAGEWEVERIRLRKADDFESLALALRLGVRATALDTHARTLSLDDGTTVVYDGLILATGASPRRLPDQPLLAGVVELRTLADSVDLRDRIAGGTARVTVIGAGFIGLEVAATARALGCAVTVLEGAPSPLIRGLGVEMGAAVAGVHARNGVHLRCGVQVASLEGEGGQVTGVRLGDGSLVASDVVVVGIGVAPNTQWLVGSGLTIGDGIVCDATLSAGVPGVYAAGDCARWPNAAFADFDDQEMRVEHWTNAAEQGAAAARNLLLVAGGGEAEPFTSVPFFWSDQFDSRIQFVGRAHGDDEVHVFAGSTDGAFAALYGYQGRLRGVLGVSMPRMVMPFRALLAANATWAEALAKAAALTAG